jgi:hypothetical protein
VDAKNSHAKNFEARQKLGSYATRLAPNPLAVKRSLRVEKKI